jgi:hypothetical protein
MFSGGGELPVPPHQRCGPNEEGGPTLARKESRDPRQHDTIGRGEARSRHLRTEHRELVTKDRDLDVLLIWRRSDPNEVEQLSNEKEGHRTARADDPGTFAASLVRARFLRLHPTGGAISALSTTALPAVSLEALLPLAGCTPKPRSPKISEATRTAFGLSAEDQGFGDPRL